MLKPDEAARSLEDVEVIPYAEVALAYGKELLQTCLAAGIPALLGRDDHCTKGCSPKVQLLVRPRLRGEFKLVHRAGHADDGVVVTAPQVHGNGAAFIADIERDAVKAAIALQSGDTQ